MKAEGGQAGIGETKQSPVFAIDGVVDALDLVELKTDAIPAVCNLKERELVVINDPVTWRIDFQEFDQFFNSFWS